MRDLKSHANVSHADSEPGTQLDAPLSITYETKKLRAPGSVVASLSSTLAGLSEMSRRSEYVEDVICRP